MARVATAFPTEAVSRLRLRVRGCVQGVGFRPFAYGLARDMGLAGHVLNDADGVLIEVEGPAAGDFVVALREQAPPLARIDDIEVCELAPTGGDGFAILESRGGRAATRIAADAAVCDACLGELRNPDSRFHGYAFVNCTHCGPRFTITRSLPYDRAQTSMAVFPMCAACRPEYTDPRNRRFHAEPVACPDCGPRLSHPIAEIAGAIREGRIVALKGIGGFHLICDARNEAAIENLRARKGRDQKPFAVMVRDIAAARMIAGVTREEAKLLESAARPIVLTDSRCALPSSLAPNLTRIGVMLAYAPVHHLLFDALASSGAVQPVALVATSANPGGEPLASGNEEAKRRLSDIADLIVTHDRDIVVRADDSVMQIINGAPAFLRRARGFVPEPVELPEDGPPVIATGADLKNTVCVTRGREAFLSQHVGSLDNAETIRFQQETIAHLCSILDVRPEFAACDLHPDFRSVRIAEHLGLPLLRVQHHLAHVAAVAAEHHLDGTVLGLAMDGHGHGADGGIWGGEMLVIDAGRWQRAGSLVPMPLPGGDKAAREPWRMAVAALHATGRMDLVARLLPDHDGAIRLARMLSGGMRAPHTSSMGRLFDAAAAISGVRLEQGYEGQAAMELEELVDAPCRLPAGYAITADNLDLMPVLAHLADRGLKGAAAANLFHGSVIAGLAAWVSRAAVKAGTRKIVLGGGCFMNRILAHGLANALRGLGLEPYLPARAPANDGGVALGQAAWLHRVLRSDPAQLEEPTKCA